MFAVLYVPSILGPLVALASFSRNHQTVYHVMHFLQPHLIILSQWGAGASPVVLICRSVFTVGSWPMPTGVHLFRALAIPFHGHRSLCIHGVLKHM